MIYYPYTYVCGTNRTDLGIKDSSHIIFRTISLLNNSVIVKNKNNFIIKYKYIYMKVKLYNADISKVALYLWFPSDRDKIR